MNTSSGARGLIAGVESLNPVDKLADFDGKTSYSMPEFIWKSTVATAIKFLDSDKLGKKYENDLFIGSVRGVIFHFNLIKDRTILNLEVH